MGLTRRKKKRTHVTTEIGKKGGVGERAGSLLPDAKNKVPACFIIGLLWLTCIYTVNSYKYEHR